MINSPYDMMRSMTRYLKTAGVIDKKQAHDIESQIDADERAAQDLSRREDAAWRRRMDERPWWKKLLGFWP